MRVDAAAAAFITYGSVGVTVRHSRSAQIGHRDERDGGCG